MTVDNIARSSMVAAILCLTLCKIALPLHCPLQAVVVIPLIRISTVCPSNVGYSSHHPIGAQHRPLVHLPWLPGA